MSTFVPFTIDITGITNAQYAVVSFASNHAFTAGEIVTLRSSKPYGMYEVNNLQTRILGVTDSTVIIEMDTTNFNTFVYPPSGIVQIVAQVVPTGSGIPPNQYVPTVTLEDVFDNLPD